MEASNGIAARVVVLERVTDRQDNDIQRNRDRIGRIETGQGVQDVTIREQGKDIEEVVSRMDKLTRAAWAFVATFSALTLTGVGIIITLLSRGG